MNPRNPLFDLDVDGNTMAWIENQRFDERDEEEGTPLPSERAQNVFKII